MSSRTMNNKDDSADQSAWVPPNDRDLTLRAQLESGWCCRSKQFEQLVHRPETISECEQKKILDVLARAQESDSLEQSRVDKMLDKLNAMKRNAHGNGANTCILCAEYLGLFRMQAHRCLDCEKMVCTKCSIDTTKEDGEVAWLCKICSEIREVKKKTGHWFYDRKPNNL